MLLAERLPKTGPGMSLEKGQ